MKDYRDRRRAFEEAGLWAGRFTLGTDPAEVTRAFIAEGMTVATGVRDGKVIPFSPSYYQSSAFPQLWVRSPTQASGELHKVVGFPLVRAGLRQELKAVPFDGTGLTKELRA